MLGLLLLYWIGKKYSALAKQYARKPVGPVIGGIVVYYLFFFVSVSIFDAINANKNYDLSMNLLATLVSMPVGLLATWGLYKYLEKKWSNVPFEENDLLDEDLIQGN